MDNQKQSTGQSNQGVKPTNSISQPKESPMQAVKTSTPLTQYRNNDAHGVERR